MKVILYRCQADGWVEAVLVELRAAGGQLWDLYHCPKCGAELARTKGEMAVNW